MANNDYPRTMFDINQHFKDLNVELKDTFNLLLCSKLLNCSPTVTGRLICGIISIDLLNEISNGNYDNIDINNESIFDCTYQEIITILNLKNNKQWLKI